MKKNRFDSRKRCGLCRKLLTREDEYKIEIAGEMVDCCDDCWYLRQDELKKLAAFNPQERPGKLCR